LLLLQCERRATEIAAAMHAIKAIRTIRKCASDSGDGKDKDINAVLQLFPGIIDTGTQAQVNELSN
jgi:hypothetical protein